MAIGLLGTKLGMTQVFDEAGRAIPVTVIQAGPCPVTQVKTADKDGYTAIQIGFGVARAKCLSKPQLGHLSKNELPPLRHLQEYRLEDVQAYPVGQELTVTLFTAGQKVDVHGTSIGRGFGGLQKRHNFRRGPMAHGSKNHRAPGSIGPGTTPGRVFPGRRMAGQTGSAQVTIRDLTVVRVDTERNLLLVKGAVPGKAGGLLSITPAKTVGRPKS
ncbi:MAG: 50S ribosomal protein L3 [Gloeomargaritaceae cyanobacterium C42_A2020_066]|nr:50S ribosomal protein L3 [Gloeomargaritaceae cyanobacterium C42_A2020_066]